MVNDVNALELKRLLHFARNDSMGIPDLFKGLKGHYTARKFMGAIMTMKTLAAFKRMAVITVVALGVLVFVNWAARVGRSHSYTLLAAQGDKQTVGDEQASPSPPGNEKKPETEEKKESAGDKKKPLEDFQPSEKIEAEQAVDFPYDI